MIWERLGIMFLDERQRAAQRSGAASGWGLTSMGGSRFPECPQGWCMSEVGRGLRSTWSGGPSPRGCTPTARVGCPELG